MRLEYAQWSPKMSEALVDLQFAWMSAQDVEQVVLGIGGYNREHNKKYRFLDFFLYGRWEELDKVEMVRNWYLVTRGFSFLYRSCC